MKSTHKSIVSSRTGYISDGLDEKTLPGNPLDLSELWMAEAERKIAGPPNAVFLASAELHRCLESCPIYKLPRRPHI